MTLTINTPARFKGYWDIRNSAIQRGQFNGRMLTTLFGVKDDLHPLGHSGVDVLFGFREPVPAPRSGEVKWISTDRDVFGLAVLVDHGNNLTALYLHFDELKVSLGQQISEGDTLGLAGATGEAYAFQNGVWVRGIPEATHLHWMCGPTDENPWMSNQRRLYNPLELLEEPPINKETLITYIGAGGMYDVSLSPEVDGALNIRITMPVQDEPGATSTNGPSN